MDEKVIVEVTDTSGNSKNYEVNFKPETVKTFTYLTKPWGLIKNAGKLGIKGVRNFFMVVALFAITNIVLLIAALTVVISSGFKEGWLSLLLVIVIGIGFTAFVAYKGYTYIMVNAFSVIYKQCDSLVMKVCNTVTNKINKATGKAKTNHNINIANIVQEKFKGLPGIVRKMLLFLFRRIPFSSFVEQSAKLVHEGKSEEASKSLYNRTNNYVTKNIFGRNNLRWAFWLLPINIIIQILIIYYVS